MFHISITKFCRTIYLLLLKYKIYNLCTYENYLRTEFVCTTSLDDIIGFHIRDTIN